MWDLLYIRIVCQAVALCAREAIRKTSDIIFIREVEELNVLIGKSTPFLE